MKMKLYNSKTKQIEEFEPKNNPVKMYTCGPTVYSSAHIGNMRSFVLADLIKRLLKYEGYKIKHITNITDVGHLISQTDEDKMEQASRRENLKAKEIAKKYTQEFLKDLNSLNVLPSDVFPRATDYIEKQIELVKKLEKNNFTYKISDGIYFDTSKFKNYGKLSGQNLTEKKVGARIKENPEKKNPSDFALWKFSPKNEKRQMEWNSPWGIGFPGWHIECSAMSLKLLGESIDIHIGGIDLLPVHHENEIAQSQSATKREVVNFWIHGEFVDMGGEKMAKSEGNILTISDLIKKEFDPISYRYLLLTTHYRTKLNFSWEALSASQNALKNIEQIARTLKTPTKPDKKFIIEFEKTLKNDLQTPRALAIMWEMLKSKITSEKKSATLLKMDEILGLNLKKWIAKPIEIPKKIKELAQKRENARKQNDFKKADEIRKEIEKNGFEIEDTQKGFNLKQKSK